MNLKIIFALIIVATLCSNLQATDTKQQIINYDRDKRNDAKYVQPIYTIEFVSKPDNVLTNGSSLAQYDFKYSPNTTLIRDIKDLNRYTHRSVLTDDGTLYSLKMISFYIHANDDMHPIGAPKPYWLKKNCPLKVLLFLGASSLDTNQRKFHPPAGFYFVTEAHGFKLPEITVKKILLQKAYRYKIEGLTPDMTQQQLLRKLIDKKRVIRQSQSKDNESPDQLNNKFAAKI